MLSKVERKAKHLAAAGFLSSLLGHARRTRSSRSSPRTTSTRTGPRRRADDAGEISDTARALLVRAGERAASLGATGEAQRAFERAGELTRRPPRPGRAARARRRAGLGRRAPGEALGSLGAVDRAVRGRRMRPIRRRGSRRASPRRCGTGAGSARRSPAWTRPFDVLAEDEPDEDLAVAGGAARPFHVLRGETRARGGVHRASSRPRRGPVASRGARSGPDARRRFSSPRAAASAKGSSLLRYALQLAREHDKPESLPRAPSSTASRDGERRRPARVALLDGERSARAPR